MNLGSEIANTVQRYIKSSSSQPTLSIFIPARNDGFMKNFNYRIETTVNYMASNLEKLGRLDEVELIIVDWGSEVPLHQVLQVNESAKKILRYIIVPPDIAVPAQKDSDFPIVLAQNVALRRARGIYHMQTDSDVMFPKDFFIKLFDVLESGQTLLGPVEKVFFSSQRRHIPWEVIASCPPMELLDAYNEKHGPIYLCDDGGEFGYCATGMMMMHRNLWAEVSGYDETLVHWGWMEIDLGMRVTRKYPWCCVSKNLDMMLYHMEHYAKNDRGSGAVQRKCNPMSRENAFRPNGQNWGLAQYVLPEYSYAAPATMLLF